MKKLLIFSIGMMAFAALSARAQTASLFTTTNDFLQWNSDSGTTISVDSSWSADTNTINGAGNTTAAGVNGVSGSLSITWASGVGTFNSIASAPSEGGNAAFLSAIDPGSSGNNSVAYSGILYLDYSLPDNEGGGYFQLGVLLQYSADGYYQTFFSSSATDLGFKDENGQEVFQATIPYTISAGNFNGFGFTILYNSNYNPLNSFHIDAISVLAPVTPPPAPPLAALFTTTNDFTPWIPDAGSSVLVQPDLAWSVNNDTTNGLGNLGAIGATGTAGSLLLDWSSVLRSYGPIADGPDEETNTAFMQAVDPGSNPGSEASVSAYGNFYIVYSQPDNSGGGNYFQIGVNLAYNADAYYQNFFNSSATDLHVQDNSGYEVYQATVPYIINAGNYYGFTPRIAINSNYQPTNGFHIGSITVSAAQAPLITSIKLNGARLVIQGTNGLSGNVFTLLTSTNLTLPLSQWTAAGTGTFYGESFSVTNTINPASPANFYSIQVPLP